MTLQIKRCPHCSRVYESGQYREKIGKPIRYCPYCMNSFLDKNVNEWKLLGISGTIYYFISVLMSMFIGGIMSGMAALFLLILPDLLFKTTFSHFIISGGGNVIKFGAVFMIIAVIYVLIREGRDISASNIRMKDENYRETLKESGLLK